MPTKHLPPHPSLDHLKYQAKDLLRAYQARSAEASQRIREFHPRFRNSREAIIVISEAPFTLGDAQLTIAREYGFQSWVKLMNHVEKPTNLDRPHHERIEDPAFREAVELLDNGDADGLHTYLIQNPGVAHQRVTFPGGNYFRNPTLLEFVAENPVRRGSMPANIVEIAKIILDIGGKDNSGSADATLELVSSGRVPREFGVQIALLDLLCAYGADPNSGMGAALAHGEFEAVEALLRHGAKLNLAVAAATGRIQETRRLWPDADGETRHRAFAFATQHGHVEIVRLLLDRGEDTGRFNPVGCHSHATPLHQAAFYGHEEVVRLLVERGAKLDIEDILFRGTPLGWAEYGGQAEIAKYLRERMGG